MMKMMVSSGEYVSDKDDEEDEETMMATRMLSIG